MSHTIISTSYLQTERAGETLAKSLAPGGFVALFGGLGAGKTAFVRGLARGLGYEGRVTSPTFSIVNDYMDEKGNTLLYHMDIYRLDSDGLFDAGFYDCLESGTACAAEWAENLGDELPPEAVVVKISGSGDEDRRIDIFFPGESR